VGIDRFVAEILVAGILITLSFTVTMFELALFSSDKIRLISMRERGVKGSLSALHLLTTPDATVNTIILLNTLANTGFSVMITEIMIYLYGPDLGSILALVIGTIVIMIFGESIPKTIGIRYSERIAVKLAPVFHKIIRSIMPLLRAVSSISSVIAESLGEKFYDKDQESFSEREVKIFLKLAQKKGVISRIERRLIEKIMRFMDLKAVDIMIPRKDLVMISVNEDINRIYELLKKYGHSRYPVYQDDVNNVIGMLHVKDLLIKNVEKTSDIKDLLRPIIKVDPETKAHDLLRIMRREGTHMAVIVDHNNNLLGAVTLEDLVEEIFGEIKDEYDIINKK